MAEMTVRVEGTVATTTTGSGTGGATETQIVGANGTSVADVSPSGNLFVEIPSDSHVTVDQGTAGAVGGSWPIKLTDGTDVADIALPAANLGAGLVTSTGTIISSTTLNALSASGPGLVIDFGSAKQNVSMVFIGSGGVSAGTVTLSVSQDNVNWFTTGTPIAVTTSAQHIGVSNVAFRYARGNIGDAIVGGTVSATLMAS